MVAFGAPMVQSHLRRRFVPSRAISNNPPERLDLGMRMRSMPAILRPVVPSQLLKNFVEDRAQRRSDVLKSLSEYIRQQGLQDPSNKQIVHCDEKLRELLGVETCTMLQLSKHISPHLQKPADVGGRYLDEAHELEEAYFVEAKAKGKDTTKPKRRASGREAGKGLFKPMLLSDDLARLCGGQKEMPRQEILKAVWSYIRENKLKGSPGTPVQCDDAMKSVFGSSTVTVQGIMKGIGPHLTKKV